MEETRVPLKVELQTPTPLLDQLPTFCQQYGSFLDNSQINQSTLKTVTETSEHMLTQLDELEQVIQSADSNITQTSKLIKPLLVQTKELQKQFALIDALDKWILQVDEQVYLLEENFRHVEKQYSQNEFKQFFFNALPLKGIMDLPTNSLEPMIKAEINTEEFFTKLKKDFK